MLNRFLLKLLEKIYLRKVYFSIDEMPVFYWKKIHETGNLSYLIKSDIVHINKKFPGKIQSKILSIQWRRLLDQFVEKFGFSDDFIESQRIIKEILRLKIQRAVNDDRSVNPMIQLAEEELAILKKEKKSSNFWELKGSLDRSGFNVIPLQTSVTEFYTHVHTLSKQVKIKNNG